MSYRDPETGEVFEDIDAAKKEFCHQIDFCEQCPIGCLRFVHRSPAEAARLMGYEVIDDSSTEIDETPTGTPTALDETHSGNRPTEEDEMKCYRNGGCGPYEQLSCGECPASKPEYNREENDGKTKHDKPRLAEVLGVEVGEKFQVSGWEDGNGGYWIDENGDIDNTTHAGISIIMLVDIINHPESIIRLPRLTEPEIAIMRAVGAKWVSRNENSEYVMLWDAKPSKIFDEDEGVCYTNGDGKSNAKLIADVTIGLFHSIHPIDCIALEDN